MSLYYSPAIDDDEPEPPPRRLVPARLPPLPPLRPLPAEARPEVLPAVTYHVPRMPYSAWLAAERAAGRPTRPGPQPGNAGITPLGYDHAQPAAAEPHKRLCRPAAPRTTRG